MTPALGMDCVPHAVPVDRRCHAARRDRAVHRHALQPPALFLGGTWLALLLSFVAQAAPVWGQSDWYPVPQRNPSRFGFPYPNPAPDEPGVTANRRYLLDGSPELDFCRRPQDEVWLLSSREVTCAAESETRLTVRRSDGHDWIPATMADLLFAINADAGNELPMENIVFVHGDRTDEFWARRRGKQLYQSFIGNRPHVRAVRYIIWAWPSEPRREWTLNPLGEFRRSLDRCLLDGLCFGQFLQALPAASDPLLVSYSLGTQVTLAALGHMAQQGGGPSYRMMSIAPVVRCDWPDRCDEATAGLRLIRQWHLVRNDVDTALRSYQLYCRLTAGRNAEQPMDELVARYGAGQQIEVSALEGKEHNLVGYVSLIPVIEEFDAMLGAR